MSSSDVVIDTLRQNNCSIQKYELLKALLSNVPTGKMLLDDIITELIQQSKQSREDAVYEAYEQGKQDERTMFGR